MLNTEEMGKRIKDLLYEIADIFNVSLDYLTARTNKKEITNWHKYKKYLYI